MDRDFSDLLMLAMKANSPIWLTNSADIINIKHRQCGWQIYDISKQ